MAFIARAERLGLVGLLCISNGLQLSSMIVEGFLWNKGAAVGLWRGESATVQGAGWQGMECRRIKKNKEWKLHDKFSASRGTARDPQAAGESDVVAAAGQIGGICQRG